jgi:hypothetical protein
MIQGNRGCRKSWWSDPVAYEEREAEWGRRLTEVYSCLFVIWRKQERLYDMAHMAHISAICAIPALVAPLN